MIEGLCQTNNWQHASRGWNIMRGCPSVYCGLLSLPKP